MSTLLELQNKFQHYLLTQENDFVENIVGTKKVSVETRLNIYKNAYTARLIEALQNTYPALYQYLGSEQFELLCSNYIQQYPSSFRSIRWYGDTLSLFLLQDDYYRDFPYLSELAKFEWISGLVFDAENSTILAIEEMGLISPALWESIRFNMHPSFYCLNLSWNVVTIWQTLLDEKMPPEPTQNETPISWLLWRKELNGQFLSVSENEAIALNEIIQGNTFGDMCEKLGEFISEEEIGIQAASFLKKWILLGIIASVKTP